MENIEEILTQIGEVANAIPTATKEELMNAQNEMMSIVLVSNLIDLDDSQKQAMEKLVKVMEEIAEELKKRQRMEMLSEGIK